MTTTASSPLLDARRALIDEEDGYVACDAPTSEEYRDERRRRRWSVGTMRNLVLVALASTLVVVGIGAWTVGSEKVRDGKFGMNDWSLEPPPEKPNAPNPILFELSAGCIDESVKASRPGFFSRDIVAAYVARHNYETNSFFDIEKHGLKMHRKQKSATERCYQRAAGTICPESDDVFELFSTEVNWEWGYVLKNDLGALFYEIGQINQHPLHGRTCKDTQKYGKYWNRLATLEKEECPATRCSGNMTGAKLADYVFSSFRFVQSVLDRSRARETRRGSARARHLVRRNFLHPNQRRRTPPTSPRERRALGTTAGPNAGLFFFLFLFIIRATFE
jgi:hypothetical protein